MIAALSGTPLEMPSNSMRFASYTGIAVTRTGRAPVMYISGARECFDGVGGMLVEVVAEEYRFKSLVLDEFVELGVNGYVTAKDIACLLRVFFIEVTNRNDFLRCWQG